MRQSPRSQGKGPRGPGWGSRQMPPSPSFRARHQEILMTLISAKGLQLNPSQGPRLHATAADRASTAKTWPARHLRQGEGSGNAGEPGSAQEGVAVAKARMCWRPSNRWRPGTPGPGRRGGSALRPRGRRGLPPSHTQRQQLQPHRGTHAREEPSDPRAHTLWGHPKILLVFPLRP